MQDLEFGGVEDAYEASCHYLVIVHLVARGCPV